MIKVKKKSCYRGHKIFVGIDVHKIKWAVCPLTQDVNFRPFSMQADPEILISYLNKTFPKGEYICAYEAGFSGYNLYERLWEANIKCLVVHPADIPTSQKEQEFKTDPRDALKIAKALRAGHINSIYIPDKQLQEDRSLIGFRQQLRKDIVRQKCRIKSFLAFYSIQIPKEYTKSKWPRKMISWLYNLELNTPEGTKALQLRMGMLIYINGMITNTDAHLRELSRASRYEKDVDLVMTVPGFGRPRAIEFLVSIGDYRRFNNLDKMANYVGLVPASSNSGEKVRQNQLTKRGHKQLRTMLIEAAWTAYNVVGRCCLL